MGAKVTVTPKQRFGSPFKRLVAFAGWVDYALTRTRERLEAVPEAFLYVLLGAGVVVFSLPALDLDFLISDDVVYYNLGLDGGLVGKHFRRMLLAPIINYLLSQAMAVSLPMARALVVMLGMVPVAIVAYLSYRAIFRLSKTQAFFAALLPEILPSQVYIPAFVIGSYTAWGLLFFYLSLLFSFRFLESTKWRWFFLSGVFYLSAVETTELSVFLLLPMLIPIFGLHPINKSSLTLAGSLALLSLYKFFYVLLGTSGVPTSRHAFDLAVALGRIRYAIGFSLPDPQLNQLGYFPLYLFLFIALGVVMHLRKYAHESPDRAGRERCLASSDSNKYLLMSYLFGFVWFVCSVAPFTVSYYFTHRYFYPAAHGLSLLIVLAVCSWLSLLRVRLLFVSAMIALTIFSGVLRLQTIEKTYAARKEVSAPLNRFLRSFKFPERSQIVVVGKGTELLYTSGYWHWSTGYLRYATKRDDISGQLGEEKGFYNPFGRRTRFRPNQMGGLTLEDPLFAFRYDGNRITQVSYCLQWGNEKDPERWTLFSMDPVKGDLTPFRSGIGEEAFGIAMKEMETRGIEQGEVLWATPPEERKQSQLKR